MPAQSVGQWPAKLTAAQLDTLRERAGRLPGELPGDLRLLAADRTSQVVDLDYSDGLSVISVFLQRGAAAGATARLAAGRVRGHAGLLQ